MIRERVRTSRLGLKIGDYLTFKDGKTRVQIEEIKKYTLFVRLPNDPRPGTSPSPLDYVTFRLDDNLSLHTKTSYINLWWTEGQTLKQRYLASVAQVSKNIKLQPYLNVLSPPKSAWLRDIHNDGNLFYTETCFRLLRNFFLQPSFTLQDRDIFLRIADIMTTQKLLSLFYSTTTETIRKDFEGREYSCILDPRDEDPKDVLCALYRHPKSNTRFRQKLVAWLDYSRKVIAKWQEANPDPAKARLEELKQQFGLSVLEHEILLASFTFYHVLFCSDFSNFRNVFGNYHDRARSIKRAVLLGITETEYKQTTNMKSRLRLLQFIQGDLAPNQKIIPYINGSCDELPKYYLSKKC